MLSKSLKLILAILITITAYSANAQCVGGDCYNGVGVQFFDNGDNYVGEWVYGERTGFGEYIWDNSSFYFGHFKNGILNGKGYYQDADGSIQSGYFVDGKLSESYTVGFNDECIGNCENGVGIYLWKNGNSYAGEWKNGERHGFGRYDWDDGSYYYGFFKNDQREGKGYYHGEDGAVMDGYFEAGNFKGKAENENDTKSDDYNTGTESKAAKSSSDSYSSSSSSDVTTAEELDFCPMIELAMKEYPNNFESFKGKKEESEYSLGDYYFSTKKVSGSIEAKVSGGFLSKHNTWYNVLYEGSFDDTNEKYHSYVSQFGKCSKYCCTLVSDTNTYKGEYHSSYMTYYLPFIVRDGYSDSYSKMVIEIEMSNSVLDKNKYDIVLRFKYFEK